MLQGKRLRGIALAILIIGFGSAISIYLTAEPTPVNPFGYDRFASKSYVRDLERFGGKFAVLTAELSQWLAELWHGKSLAVVIAISSLSLALLLWYIGTSRQSSHEIDPEDRTGHHRDSG
jgi:hypothetical protein